MALPRGATISTAPHEPAPSAAPGSTGSVNLLEKLKFTEPAPATPTKAAPNQPASNFTFHQQTTTAPRSSSKKPNRLVSAASRTVRTEQQPPGRARDRKS